MQDLFAQYIKRLDGYNTFQKMGRTSSDPQFQKDRNIYPYYNSSHPTPTFISSAATQYRLLSQFRGMLSFEECLYTFATLLKQYSEILKKRQNILISDQHCKVSSFGQILVVTKMNIPQGQLQNKFSQMIERLFDLVNALSIQSEWANNRSVMKLKQKVKKIISFFDGQQQLFANIFEQFSQFLSKAKMQDNLVGALNRLKQRANRKCDFQDSVQQRKDKKHPSLATISAVSSQIVDNVRMSSNRNHQRKRKSNFSHINEENKFCQNSGQKSSYFEKMHFQNSFQSQSSAKNSFKKKNFSYRYSITPQYSININGFQRSKQRKSPQVVKVKRERYRTQTLRQSPFNLNEAIQLQKMPKNKTSIYLNGQKPLKQRIQNSLKSVLDTMARLVQVKETSSSDSHIY